MEATPDLVRELQAALTRTGNYRGEANGELDGATRAALADFAGQVNLESKIREDGQLYRSLVREVQEVSGAAGG
jgi:peptidoglycan hydrolase-like protein with peptidoglycan-binding domain